MFLGYNFEFFMFEISNLWFVRNEFLSHTVNFGIGSAYFKDPRSTFSECSDPWLGLLYKVCSLFVAIWKRNKWFWLTIDGFPFFGGWGSAYSLKKLGEGINASPKKTEIGKVECLLIVDYLFLWKSKKYYYSRYIQEEQVALYTQFFEEGFWVNLRLSGIQYNTLKKKWESGSNF